VTVPLFIEDEVTYGMADDILDLPPQRVFDLLGNDANLWTYSSLALFASAEAVEQSCGRTPRQPHDLKVVFEWMQMHGVSRMLRGMGFECLFKALWLASGGSLASKGKYRGIPGARDHDLCSLGRKVSELVDTRLDDEQRRVLARLSFFITHGRYPIRKSFSEQRPSAPDADGPTRWCRWTPKDERVLKQLEQTLLRLIRKYAED